MTVFRLNSSCLYVIRKTKKNRQMLFPSPGPNFNLLSPRVIAYLVTLKLICAALQWGNHLTVQIDHKRVFPRDFHVPVQISVSTSILDTKLYTQQFSFCSHTYLQNKKNVKIISTLESFYSEISPTHTMQKKLIFSVFVLINSLMAFQKRQISRFMTHRRLFA